MRATTCLFFAIATLLLGDIAAGAGASDPIPRVAAIVFAIAAAAFFIMDWPKGAKT